MVWFKVKYSNTGKYKHGVTLIKAFTVNWKVISSYSKSASVTL